MLKYKKSYIFFCIYLIGVMLLSIDDVCAQTGVSETSNDTTYLLLNDTLFASAEFKIFSGQKLIIGKGTEENGWYKTIGFKSYLSWPVLLFSDMETKNNYDYQSDPQRRVNDKVTEYLVTGDTLKVIKLARSGNKHRGYYFVAYLQNTNFPKINFLSTITNSISTKELILP